MQTEWTDGTIRIRPYRPDDVEPHCEAVRESLDELGQWLSWVHPDYGPSDSASWIASRAEAWRRGEAYSFVVEDAETGRLLGGSGLNHLNETHRLANLGYWTRASAAGRGVATAATRLTAQFGVRERGLHRIEIVVAVGNRASQRVAEKAGATHEGVLRHRLRMGETSVDAHMYSLLPSDMLDLLSP